MNKIIFSALLICFNLLMGGNCSAAGLDDRSLDGNVETSIGKRNIGLQFGPSLSNLKNDESFALNLFYFEYIADNGFGIQISPFNTYGYKNIVHERLEKTIVTYYYTSTISWGTDVDISSLYYLPLMLKYNFLGKEPLPYVGFGLAYHRYLYQPRFVLTEDPWSDAEWTDEWSKKEVIFVPVLNAGINFFTKKNIWFVFDTKYFLYNGGENYDSAILALSIGLNINF